MKLFALTLLLLATSVKSSQYIKENGTRYFVSYPGLKLANWFEAQRYCNINGMHLATIHTLEENETLMSVIRKANSTTTTHYWTSGTDIGHAVNEWYWAPTGYPMVFKNWMDGSPLAAVERDCVVLHAGHQHKFYDQLCTARFYFICQDRLSLPDTLKSQHCQIQQ